MTVRHTILEACLDAGELTDSQVVVRAWLRDKATFGLDGFKDLHPDSNKVLSCLMGGRGLVARGLLARVAKRRYVLTELGVKAVKLGIPRSSGSARVVLACMGTQAYRLYTMGMRERISRRHAEEYVALAVGLADATNLDGYQVGAQIISKQSVGAALRTLEYVKRVHIR